ncbi:hypothetical protein [Streptomyces sp. NPDC127112]|uniref:hypothetical protein n=1 Tax=Streptomyces sp. NPDC127112 TaxID=3345364 RepID=UPI0036423E3A
MALDEALEGASGPQAAVQELLGERQLWWNCCGEAFRRDPSWLSGRRAEDLRAWLDTTVPDRTAGSVTLADHAWLLARAMSTGADRAGEHDRSLSALAADWKRNGLVSADAAPGPAQPSGRGLAGLPPHVTGALRGVVRRIQDLCDRTVVDGEPTGAWNTLVIASLLMAGARSRGRSAVSVPVVFGRSAGGPAGQNFAAEGVTGILELSEFPAGPAGLYPDPRAMAGVHSPNGQFAASLGSAWYAAGSQREGRCVLWRLVLADDPLPPARIEGPSLGAAFALGLRELLRRSSTRRPGAAWLRSAFYGLRPRTAVTGTLGGGEILLKVSDMDAKLLAAHNKGLRLVAPEPNRLDAAHAPTPGDVRFARTLKQADRYARRFRTGRLAVALALTVTATTTGLVVTHRDTAAMERLATAHRLAEVSQNLLSTDVGRAELFAVEAYRHHPDSLTRSALFQAVTASPHLAGSIRASGRVSTLATSGNDAVVLAGTDQGEVQQWQLTGTAPGPARLLGRLPGPIVALAADDQADTVAAIDHSTVRVWASAQPATAPQTAAGRQPTAVGVSPSGRMVAVTTTTGKFGDKPTLWVLDQSTGTTTHVDLDLPSDPKAIAFTADLQVVVFESAYGSWAQLSVPALTQTAGSTVGFGNHNQASALSPYGGHLSYVDGSLALLPIWSARGTPDFDRPEESAQNPPGPPPVALALSLGSRAAQAVGTTIYVSERVPSDRTPPPPIALTGAGSISRDALTFLGENALVSASGDLLSLWDLKQQSRIATQTSLDLPTSCNGCGGPAIALSPDGRIAAVVSGNRSQLEIKDVRASGPLLWTSRSSSSPDDPGVSAATWRRDGSGLIAVSPDGSAKIISRAERFEVSGTWPAEPKSDQLQDPAVHLRFLPDGLQVAELDESGTVRFRDAANGKVLRQVDGPKDMALGSGALQLPRNLAALDGTAVHAAVFDLASSATVVTDTSTGHSRTIAGADTDGLAFAGNRLLIQRKTGSLEVWTASGDQHLDTIEGTPDTSVGPAVGGGYIIAEKARGDTVRLMDLQTGQVLGALALPVGVKSRSTDVAISADGTSLVSATEAAWGDESYTGRLTTWDLGPESWIRTACASVAVDLTPDLWRQYMGTAPLPDRACGA